MAIGGPQGHGYSLQSHEYNAAGHRFLTVAALKGSVSFMAIGGPERPPYSVICVRQHVRLPLLGSAGDPLRESANWRWQAVRYGRWAIAVIRSATCLPIRMQSGTPMP